MSACHTMNPDADQLEECLRIKLYARTIDQTRDRELQQVCCTVCGFVLCTEWREKPAWLGMFNRVPMSLILSGRA